MLCGRELYVKSVLIGLFCFFVFPVRVQAQDDVNTRLDVLLRMAALCRDASAQAAESHSDSVMRNLNSVLDSLDVHQVHGLLESCMMSELTRCALLRKDPKLLMDLLVNFRNRTYRLLEKEITDSFYYGWGRLRPGTNSWIGESYLSLYLYRCYTLNAALLYPNDLAAQLGYEILLHDKNLKLKADNVFKFMARETGSEQIRQWCRRLYRLQQDYVRKERYIRSLPLREQLNVYESGAMHTLEGIADTISLIRDSMFHHSSMDYSYVKQFTGSWLDVRNSLSRDELAIEFAEIPVAADEHFRNFQNVYVAFAITRSAPVPRVITLFTEEQIRHLDLQSLEGLEQLYALVWKPLAPLFQKLKRIYFSPDGLMHKLPLEAAFQVSDSASRARLYRLSSTWQLLRKPERKSKYMHMAIYGGLDYECSEYHRCATDTLPEQRMNRGFSNARETRGTRDYLGWTLKEVNDIERVARRRSRATVTKFTGCHGTEESFYDLSEGDVDLLHISTHGFYYTPRDMEDIKSSGGGPAFLNVEGEEEDEMLASSGLILSGANQALRERSAPKDQEDGILTAREISTTDLSSCDLVVLSACQTGLGDISPEGIYGLQRGFKKAGVGTLLLSLWEVDDEATALLMKRFYELLFRGYSKLDALRGAQRFVAGYSAEYRLPYYWGGWILLDALN